MKRTARIGLICALAALVLAATTTVAAGSTGVRLASGTALTVTARGPFTLAIGINLTCTFDLLFAVASAINKVVGSSLATIRATGSTIASCSGGISGTIDNDIAMTYGSFGGTLPTAITSMQGIARAFTFTLTGGTLFGTNRCQYVGDMSTGLHGPGTSFDWITLSGNVRSSGGRCITPARITSGTLALYANAALGTTLTSLAVALF